MQSQYSSHLIENLLFLREIIKKSAKGLKRNFIEFYNPDNYYFCTAICGYLLDVINKALCKLMQTKLPSVVISVPQIKDVEAHLRYF